MGVIFGVTLVKTRGNDNFVCSGHVGGIKPKKILVEMEISDGYPVW